ncbi:transcriptional regulator [Alteromonas aestuariivivens]|uniref:Transcriptional regulator n=2 Tax=Alteromonas aestuariivivens TaxID=1938339 RepID=A0A3D8M3Y6_9ALTE|nr:transcriptional regulator [Alteromonas aestuariivivens]
MQTNDLLAHAADAERYLKQLANKTRLMVLCCLLDKEMSVTDLLVKTPVTQPVLSQHLAVLREAGLVDTRREGQVIWYRLADERVARTIELLHQLFCQAD